jgi:uncharacterized membrane protein
MVTLSNRYTYLFPDKDSADRWIKDLRKQGVKDDDIAVVSKYEQAAATAGGAAEGLTAGAAIGAIFGLAAAFIPGVGPFITAGFLAPTLGAVAGGAAAGAIVGGTAGLISGALSKAGYAAHEAKFFGDEIENGRVLVSVEKGAAIPDTWVTGNFTNYGGYTYVPKP